jgi:hypothetical protein
MTFQFFFINVNVGGINISVDIWSVEEEENIKKLCQGFT